MKAFVIGLQKILNYTAWEMEIPPAYGAFHLIFMLSAFAISAILAWRLRGVGDKGNKRIFLSIGIFLLVSEVYKQLMYCLVVEPGGDYHWGAFPFQLCSIPMYFCVIIPLLKGGKVQKAMYNFLMMYNFLGGFIAFFEPSGLLHGYVTLTLHSLIWHSLLVFIGLYIFFSGRGGTERSDYLSATATFGILTLIAFIINCSFWELSKHSIKMFFVGPGNSPIIVFKWISEQFGWVICTVLYIASVCVGVFLLVLLLRFLRKRFKLPSVRN